MFKDYSGEQEERDVNSLLHEDETLALGFTQIPNQVLYARNLSPQARTLYGILLSYSWKEDRCFPGYARLCEHMNLSEKIVRKHMRELEAVNLLRQKRRGLGKTNLYTLLSLKNAKLDYDFERERETGPVQNRDEGNAQKQAPYPGKEYEDEEDSFTKTKNSSKNTRSGMDEVTASPTVTATSTNALQQVRREPTATGNEKETQKITDKPGSKPKEKERIAAFVGKPITQDEIDEKRRQGKNASGYTPLANIPPEHWEQLETSAKKAPVTNLNKTHYNNSTRNSPVFIDAIIDKFSELLGDDLKNTARNINRTAKLFRKSGMNEEAFKTLLYEAFDQVKRYPAEKIKKQGADGRPNRMPVFFGVLEEKAGLRQPAAG